MVDIAFATPTVPLGPIVLQPGFGSIFQGFLGTQQAHLGQGDPATQLEARRGSPDLVRQAN